MKQLIYVLTLLLGGWLLLPGAAQAQVKIGANAKTIGSNSNLEVEAANGKKMIVDKGTGAVTINAATTIKDGTEGAGKIWTSDANGTGSWVGGATVNVVTGTLPNSWPSIPFTNNPANAVNTGARITLPPGRWLLYFNATYANGYNAPINIWWDLSTSNTTNTITGRTLSAAAPTNTFSPVSAAYNVAPTTTTTYYMWAFAFSNANVNATGVTNYSGEGRIFAIPVSN